MMQLADFEFVQLTQDTDILPFLSEDEDLNNFLIEDAKNYSADLMAVTYLFIDKEKKQIINNAKFKKGIERIGNFYYFCLWYVFVFANIYCFNITCKYFHTFFI